MFNKFHVTHQSPTGGQSERKHWRLSLRHPAKSLVQHETRRKYLNLEQMCLSPPCVFTIPSVMMFFFFWCPFLHMIESSFRLCTKTLNKGNNNSCKERSSGVQAPLHTWAPLRVIVMAAVINLYPPDPGLGNRIQKHGRDAGALINRVPLVLLNWQPYYPSTCPGTPTVQESRGLLQG